MKARRSNIYPWQYLKTTSCFCHVKLQHSWDLSKTPKSWFHHVNSKRAFLLPRFADNRKHLWVHRFDFIENENWNRRRKSQAGRKFMSVYISVRGIWWANPASQRENVLRKTNFVNLLRFLLFPCLFFIQRLEVVIILRSLFSFHSFYRVGVHMHCNLLYTIRNSENGNEDGRARELLYGLTLTK